MACNHIISRVFLHFLFAHVLPDRPQDHPFHLALTQRQEDYKDDPMFPIGSFWLLLLVLC